MIKKLIGISLIVILTDCLVQAIPAAYAFSQSDAYLPQDEQGAVKNFFRSLGFHSVIYLIMVSPIYIILIGVFTAIIRLFKQTARVCILFGAFVSLTAYLIYAYRYSVDWSFSYFPYRILWFTLLGSFFGWMYFRMEKPAATELNG